MKNQDLNVMFDVVQSNEIEGKKAVRKEDFPVFNQLLQFAPEAVLVNEVSRTQYMKVVSSGALVSAKDGNGYLGIVKDSTSGKVSSHARLFDPENLKQALKVSVALRAVSVAVGQAHLSEISQELNEINQGIKDIKIFLDNERKSKAESISHYLDEYFLSAQEGFNLSDIRRQQLEQDSREIDAILRHLTKEIDNITFKVKLFEDTSMFGSTKAFEDLQNLMQESEMCLSQWFAVVQIKAKTVQALLLSNEYELFEQRKNSLLSQIMALNSNQLIEFREIWLNKIDSLDAKLSTEKELAFQRVELRNSLERVLNRVKNIISNMNVTIDNLGKNVGEDIVFEMVENKLTNIYISDHREQALLEYQEQFLVNIGKNSQDFELVPFNLKDAELATVYELEKLEREIKVDNLVNNAQTSLDNAKELASDVGSKLGGMFKKIKW